MERFHVDGMTCGHSARAVADTVRALDAGASITVDLRTGLVEVESLAARPVIAYAIEAEGYRVAS